MARSQHRTFFLGVIALCAVALAVAATPPAAAKTYTDVPKSHWAYDAIKSVTNRASDGHYLLDDYGAVFKPETAITRALLARSLVLASGQYGVPVKPVAIKDVPAGHRYYNVIQTAVHLGYLSVDKNGYFKPDSPVTAINAEKAIIRWLKGRYATSDWSLLNALKPSAWEPNEGWKTGAPSYLPYIVASRQLQLRYNHPDSGDRHEVTPNQPIDRGEVAYMFWRAFKAGDEYGLYGLGDFKDVTFPALSDRQKEITSFALQYIGYPYIWGGEYPTRNSPYGYQKAGGFDCSGFVFYVMKMHFDYPITVYERGAHDMAARAKPRITRKKLTCGDLIFFGPKGKDSTVISIYHAGLYLGNGWFIHSTGTTDGVMIQSLDAVPYYAERFAWGRRVLKPEELVVSPAPTPAPVAAPATVAAPQPGE